MILINLLPHREERRKRRKAAYFAGLAPPYDERIFHHFVVDDGQLAINMTKHGMERPDARSETIQLLRMRYFLTERVLSYDGVLVVQLVGPQRVRSPAHFSRCLDHLQWADEIVIVDSGSTDETAHIAEAYGAKVIDFKWNGKAIERLKAANIEVSAFVDPDAIQIERARSLGAVAVEIQTASYSEARTAEDRSVSFAPCCGSRPGVRNARRGSSRMNCWNSSTWRRWQMRSSVTSARGSGRSA